MLVAIADTHGSEDHRLEGAVLEAVRAADLVVHAGDFTTPAVYAAIEREATDLAAVYGNNDASELRARLPATRVVAALGRRFVVAHGHEHSETQLGYLARETDAQVVIVGHSHDPGVAHLDGVMVVNPGSYADPRWHRPGFAVFERDGAGIVGRLRDPGGETFGRFELEGRSGPAHSD